MRTKYYFGAFAALALGLASCASDEPTVDPGSPTGGERYMAVTIKTVGDATRALPGDTDFESGVGNENSVTAENIRFYFFTDTDAPYVMSRVNVNGTVSNTNMLAPQTLNTNIDNTNGETKSITGVLVLGTEAEGYKGNRPAKVVAVANRKSLNFEDLANIPLSQLQAKVSTIPTNDFDASSFTMTSSSYLDEAGNVICYTDVTNNIKETAEAAKNEPAVIYLERLAAKVRVQGLGEYTAKKRNEGGQLEDAEFTIWTGPDTSVKTKLNVSLEGWQLINRANHTYVLKNIDAFKTTAPYPDWNDFARHRSYWAYTRANTSTDFDATTYQLYAGNDFQLGNFNPENATANVAYTFGNTGFATTCKSATDRDKDNLATAIMVKAVVKMPGVDGAPSTPINLVKWGAEYFTYDYFKSMVIQAYNTETTRNVSEDAFGLKKITGTNTYVVTVSNAEYARFNNISWWQNGITSYRANILHYTDGADKNLYGVVRNHIYDYKFTNVFGLGVPGEDPVNPPVEEETFLAAVVRVLNWHIVSYDDVTLGE